MEPFSYDQYSSKGTSRRLKQSSEATNNPKFSPAIFNHWLRAVSRSGSGWPILLLFLCCCFHAAAQEKILQYDVVRNGSVIGYLTVTKKIKDSIVYLGVRSEVKTSLFFFSYSSRIMEDAVFENGAMICSSYYKKENDKEISIHRKKSGGYFNVVDKKDNTLPRYLSLHHNTLQLYCNSPGSDIRVYSNHYGQFLDVKKIDENRYRLILPDGNSNYYNYKNGICTQVDIERALFTIHFILKKQT